MLLYAFISRRGQRISLKAVEACCSELLKACRLLSKEPGDASTRTADLRQRQESREHVECLEEMI